MVQDFIEDVSLNWELKMMFFDRVYSHSVARPPTHPDAQGKWRNEYLSSLLGKKEALLCFPCQDVIQKAAGVLSLIPGRLSYARVDLVVGRLGLGGDDGDDKRPGAAFWQELGFVLDESKNTLEGLSASSVDRQIYLMEVELIEPSLYLSPRSAQILGDLVLGKLNEGRR